MLAKLCAVVFLALAISPCTAPFQTFDEANATVIVAFNQKDAPGSLVAPLVTKPGRLMVALPAGFAVSHFVPVAFLPRFVPPDSHVHRDANRLTVLRV